MKCLLSTEQPAIVTWPEQHFLPRDRQTRGNTRESGHERNERRICAPGSRRSNPNLRVSLWQKWVRQPHFNRPRAKLSGQGE